MIADIINEKVGGKGGDSRIKMEKKNHAGIIITTTALTNHRRRWPLPPPAAYRCINNGYGVFQLLCEATWWYRVGKWPVDRADAEHVPGASCNGVISVKDAVEREHINASGGRLNLKKIFSVKVEKEGFWVRHREANLDIACHRKKPLRNKLKFLALKLGEQRHKHLRAKPVMSRSCCQLATTFNSKKFAATRPVEAAPVISERKSDCQKKNGHWKPREHYLNEILGKKLWHHMPIQRRQENAE
ncbi:hypothetical protein Tco_0570259 [Tanacetum coccineum]